VVAGGVALGFAVLLFVALQAAGGSPPSTRGRRRPRGADRRLELVFSLTTAAVVVASVRVLGVLLIAAAVVPGRRSRGW
jgi:hypothetical protein